MKGPIILFVSAFFLALTPVFSQDTVSTDASPAEALPLETSATQSLQSLQPSPVAANLAFMTQIVWKTQYVRGRGRAPGQTALVLPPKLEQKAWFFPGMGQIGLGQKTKGVVQASVFSATIVASVSFLIAGSLNFKYCQEKNDEALAEINYASRSNLFVQRDRYYNKYNILISYAEASLVAAAVVYCYSIFDFYYTRKRLTTISLSADGEGFELAYRKRY